MFGSADQPHQGPVQLVLKHLDVVLSLIMSVTTQPAWLTVQEQEPPGGSDPRGVRLGVDAGRASGDLLEHKSNDHLTGALEAPPTRARSEEREGGRDRVRSR